MRDKKKKKNKLAYYSYKGNVNKVKQRIAKGANIREKDDRGWSALHVASRQGHSEIVKLLLDGKNENKADVDDRTKVSDTALHFASYHCHKDIVNILLDAGANKEVKNDYGRSPLHFLAESSHGSDPSRLDDIIGIIDLLTNDSEHINSKDKFGNTPLFFAVEYGNKLTAQLLLDKGADVNETNEEGRRLSTYIKTQSMDRIIHTGVEAYSNGMSFTASDDEETDSGQNEDTTSEESGVALNETYITSDHGSESNDFPVNEIVYNRTKSEQFRLSSIKEEETLQNLEASINNETKIIFDHETVEVMRNRTKSEQFRPSSIKEEETLQNFELSSEEEEVEIVHNSATVQNNAKETIINHETGSKEFEPSSEEEEEIVHNSATIENNGKNTVNSHQMGSKEFEQSEVRLKVEKIEHNLFQLLNYPKNQDPNAAVNEETEIDYDPGTGLNEVDVSSDEEEEIMDNPDIISEHKEEESVDSVKYLNVQNNLSHYAFEGNIEKVKQLIAQGANIHEKDDRGLSALHLASRQGHSEIVELLLDRRNENKADVDDRTCNSNTALHLASYHCHKDTVKVLVDAGAHRDVKNDYGSCPLHFIAESSHGSDPSRSEDIIGIIELLAFNSNFINLKDDCGNTPLHYAVKNGNKLTAQSLLEKGADPNVTNQREGNDKKIAYGSNYPYCNDMKVAGYRTLYDDIIFCFTFWCGGPSSELLAFLLFVEFASYVLWYLRTCIVL